MSDPTQEMEGLSGFTLPMVLEAVQEGITFSDSSGHFLVYNAEMQRLTGYSKEEAAQAEDFNRLLHPTAEEANSALNQLEQYELNKRYEGETVFLTKDGQKKNVLVSTIVLPHGDQKLYLSAYRDISQLKQVERVLQEEKQEIEWQVSTRTAQLTEALQAAEAERDKISAIVQSIGDAVLVLDERRCITLVNRVGCELAGLKAEEMLGRPYREAYQFIQEVDGSEVTDFIDTVFETGQMASMAHHTLLKNKASGTIPVADSAAPLKNEEGRVVGCVVVFRDVSQERDVERMKEDFLSMASHQLRTPLTALRWQTHSLLSLKSGPLNQAQLEKVAELNLSAKRLIELVNDLLDLARLDSGVIPLKAVPTDLQEMVKGALIEIGSRFEQKKLRISVEGKELPLVNIDPGFLRQVLQNLLVNACKYTPDGGTVKVEFQAEAAAVVVRITDSGYGILDSAKQHIFERFYRSNQEEVQKVEGSGLGLYLAKKIVEASGGQIGFESQAGQGTTFWVSLPAAAKPN